LAQAFGNPYINGLLHNVAKAAAACNKTYHKALMMQETQTYTSHTHTNTLSHFWP